MRWVLRRGVTSRERRRTPRLAGVLRRRRSSPSGYNIARGCRFLRVAETAAPTVLFLEAAFFLSEAAPVADAVPEPHNNSGSGRESQRRRRRGLARRGCLSELEGSVAAPALETPWISVIRYRATASSSSSGHLVTHPCAPSTWSPDTTGPRVRQLRTRDSTWWRLWQHGSGLDRNPFLSSTCSVPARIE